MSSTTSITYIDVDSWIIVVFSQTKRQKSKSFVHEMCL